MSEESSSIFIFGDRQIDPELDGEEYKFTLPDGASAIWVKKPTNKIPVDISDRDAGSEKSTFEKNLIFIGNMYFGAEWDPELKKFVVDEKSKTWREVNPLSMIDRLETWRGMKDTKGLSERKIQNYIKILKAYQKEILIDKSGEDVSAKVDKEKQKQKRAEKIPKLKKDQTADKMKKDFMNLPAIKDWKKYLTSKGKERQTGLFDMLYKVLAVNDETMNPEFFTLDLEGEPMSKKVDEVKKAVEIYRHWAMTYYTPPEFYKKAWRSSVFPSETDKDDEGNPLGKMIKFPNSDEIFFKLERTLGKTKALHKQGTYREYEKSMFDPDLKMEDGSNLWTNWKEYAGGSYAVEGTKTRIFGTGKKKGGRGTTREKNAVRDASTAISSFILSAKKGEWEMPDQDLNSILSKKIDPPKHADIGQEFSDDEILMGRKFLETGIAHHWEQLPPEKIKFTYEGQEMERDISRRKLVPDVQPKNKKPDPHYNETLPQYKKFGSPYGELKPASMFFRLAMLTGWRITEGVTCGSEEITRKSLEAGTKRSGWWLESNGNMSVAFQVRKTQKHADESYFEAVIPPYSTEVLDTAETMKRIFKKTNTRRFIDEDTKKKLWNPESRPLTKPEQEKNARELAKEKIFPSRVLVGENGMFFPEMSGDTPTFQLQTGGEIDALDNSEFILAYLAFPLREMFAQLDKTGVKVKEGKEIEEMSRTDREMDKRLGKTQGNRTKVFGTEHGWAVTCGDGCRKSTRTGKKDKDYTHQTEKAIQDKLRYDDPQDYWIDHPQHSLRHLFAQLWLGKTGWNYGFVADTGHWTILQTLKDHYGKIPKKIMGERIMDLMAKERISFADEKGRTDSRDVLISDIAQNVAKQDLTKMGETAVKQSAKYEKLEEKGKEEQKAEAQKKKEEKKKQDKQTVTTAETKTDFD